MNGIMKKLIITIAIVFAVCATSFAQTQKGGGLFQYGAVSDEQYYGSGYFSYDRPAGFSLMLPDQHGESGDFDAVPLGSGALLLIGFGAAYALKKKSSKR